MDNSDKKRNRVAAIATSGAALVGIAVLTYLAISGLRVMGRTLEIALSSAIDESEKDFVGAEEGAFVPSMLQQELVVA